MVEWGRKFYLGPAEMESFVYYFGQNPGVRGELILSSSLYGFGVDQGNKVGR